MTVFTYKIQSGEPKENADYAIRYTEDRKDVHAKTKKGKEFKTDLIKNNEAYETYLSGDEVTQKQYEDF